MCDTTIFRLLSKETYEILVTNFLEFEVFLLESAAKSAVREIPPYLEQHELKMGSIVRLANFLSSARMYVDQVPRRVQRCFSPGEEQKAAVVREFSRCYDTYPEYRFMEALRNHVQHCGVPVHWTETGMGWTSVDADGVLEYYVEIASLRSILEEDGKFKRAVLDELGNRVALSHAVRLYTECLSSTQDTVRTLLDERVAAARRDLQSAHDRFPEKDELTEVALKATKTTGENTEEVPLLLTCDVIRDQLRKKNKRLTNLRKVRVIGGAR